jgi:hypothetical protein
MARNGSPRRASNPTQRVLAPTKAPAIRSCKSCFFNKLILVASVRFPPMSIGRSVMIAMLELTTLVLITIFAVVVAAGLHWLLLKVAFLMMRPATLPRIPARTELAHGAAQLARAYSAHR